MVHKNQKIPLVVLRTIALGDATMVIYFVRPIGFEYEAGDWMDINFIAGNPRGGITYSFCSSPTEPELAIAFKIGISPFKKALQAVQPGDELYISQYGNDYNFYLSEHRSSVFIAGGIGIAPFRSMLKAMVDTHSNDPVQLVYLNKGQGYVFAAEIEEWQKQLLGLEVVYIDTTDQNRKKREKLLLASISKMAHYYFIAGPEGMVELTEHLLIDAGIESKYIRIDSFGGY